MPAKLITTNLPDNLPPFERNVLYNGMDVLITRTVYDKLNGYLDPITKATYRQAVALQGPVMAMMNNGFLVDQAVKTKFIYDLEAKVARLNSIISRLAEDGYGFTEYFRAAAEAELAGHCECSLEDARAAADKSNRELRKTLRAANDAALKIYDTAIKTLDAPFNGRSVKQKSQLLYNLSEFGGYSGPVGLAPICRVSKTTKKRGPVTDREALEQIVKTARTKTETSRYFWAGFVAKAVLALMDLAKELDELKSVEDSDGYFRASFSAAGTNTGRFNSGKNPMGRGSNFQNRKERLRQIFTAPIGHKVAYLDLEQAESRKVGAITFTLFGAHDYLDACESSDLHTLVTSMCWRNLGWPKEFSLETIRKYGGLDPEVVSAAKKIAKQTCYRTLSYRDMSKRLGHGSNYRGKPPHMANILKVDRKIVEDFQARYFDAFPEIPRWHRYVAEQLQTTRQLTSLMGRRRIFFGRPYEDDTLRKAIAYNPQSSTADYLSLGILRLWDEIVAGLPIALGGQVHDAVAFTYPEAEEDRCIAEAARCLEPKLLLRHGELSREFSVPVECLVGWNLAYPKHGGVLDNPDGLVEWSGPGSDQRKRQGNPNQDALALLTL